MPPVEERAELGGYHAGPWTLGSAAYKPAGHASRQLLVEEGMLLFSPHQGEGGEGEEGIKPFRSVISNIDYFVGEFL